MTDLLTRFTTRADLHQSLMHKELMRLIGWQTIELTKGSQLFFRTLGPLGIAKIQRPMTIDLEKLNQLRKDKHIFTLYIEPGLTYEKNNQLKWSVEPFAHSATSLIDLNLSEAELLASFSQKTRYNIGHTLRKNEITIVTKQLDQLTPQEKTDFFTLHHHWSHERNVVGYSVSLLNAILSAYGQSGDLHLAYKGSTLVGSLLILYHDHVATYWAAFASPLGYKIFAPTLLTWKAIQTAKEKDGDIFDFGGIYDARYPKMYKKWRGFTKFKEGFSPTPLIYPPTYLKLFW